MHIADRDRLRRMWGSFLDVALMEKRFTSPAPLRSYQLEKESPPPWGSCFCH
jgi:hypothetical protein